MSTNVPQKSKYRSIFEEVGMVGLVLSFVGSDVTLSSLTVFLAKLFGLPGQEEINPILEVLLTSFPLTVATAVMFVYYKQRKLTLLNVTYMLFGVFWAYFFLTIILWKFFNVWMPSVPFRGNLGILGAAASYLFNYLRMYGPFPFIKSLVLGYFFGKWYLRLAVVASKPEQSKKKLDAKDDTETG